ncbi:MAG: type II secretion system protein M [Magnetococcales bacterium]|nr:type II secretion system protein M [Magnetococcales bacterium]
MLRNQLRELQARWLAVGDRERTMVIGGGAVMSCLLFFALVWLPVQERFQELSQTVESRSSSLRWMEQAAREVARLKSQTGIKTPLEKGESLLSLADRSVRSHGLAPVLRRVEPEGQDKVRLWFEQAAFQSLLVWLETLHDRYGVEVVNASIEKGRDPGLVNTQLVLIMRAAQ